MGKSSALLQQIIGVALFGAVGLFRRWVPLAPGTVAMIRGLIGAAFLLAVRHRKPDFAAIRRNLVPLLVSGACMGANWMLFFKSLDYTTVATATLCYYMAPVVVMLASPFLLRERLSPVKAVCVLAALGGMVLVSGVLEAGFDLRADGVGVALALAAAVLYACVILSNKKLRDIDPFNSCTVQLSVAGLVMVPYVLLLERNDWGAVGWTGYGALAVICILITGVAYVLYFGSMQHLSAQTVAVLGYIDPVVAVLLSWLFLGEGLGVPGILGAVLILGATLCSELFGNRKK